MKNTLVLMALFSIASLSAMEDQHKNACVAMEPTTHVIEPFNMMDHLSEFTDLFLKEKETLVRRPGFDLNKML